MTNRNFTDVLGDALALLEHLDCSAASVTHSKRLAAKWASEHPDVSVDLVIDRQPGRDQVEYDLLLGHPQGATVALSFRSDDGSPWAVSYADHWAANYVVTVNGEHITVQQALRELEMEAHRDPSLMTKIVDQVLVLQAVNAVDQVITLEEVQMEVDTFRRALRLERSKDMAAWLKERRLTKAEFGGIMAATVMAKRVRARVAGEREKAHYEAHRQSYDKMTAAIAHVQSSGEAEALGAASRSGGLMRAVESEVSRNRYPSVEVTFSQSFAVNLPAWLRAAHTGQVVGPLDEGGSFSLGQIYAREPAILDPITRDAVRQAVYAAWLGEQRKAAQIRWHWL